MPVELLSKEFTRLNNPHPYRIHYLGPRFLDSLALHRRYAYSEDQGEKRERDADRGGDGEYCRPYPAPLRRIVSSNYMNVELAVVRSDCRTTTTIGPRSSTGPSKG